MVLKIKSIGWNRSSFFKINPTMYSSCITKHVFNIYKTWRTLFHLDFLRLQNSKKLYLFCLNLQGKGSINSLDALSLTRLKTKANIEIVYTST
jgi:hypothetical protein